MPPRNSDPASETDESQEQSTRNGEANLRWVLEESGEFTDLPKLDQMSEDQVVEMAGGVDASTYLVKGPDRDVIVKLNSSGARASFL